MIITAVAYLAQFMFLAVDTSLAAITEFFIQIGIALAWKLRFTKMLACWDVSRHFRLPLATNHLSRMLIGDEQGTVYPVSVCNGRINYRPHGQ